MRLAVLGAGAWGTALALSFAERHAVTLWTWQAEHAAAMLAARENTAFLPGYPFPDALGVTADLALAVTAADLAIIATPMAGLRATAGQLAQNAPKLPFLWVCKGLEAGTGLLPHQVVAAVHPRRTLRRAHRPQLRRRSGARAADRDHAGLRRRRVCRSHGA